MKNRNVGFLIIGIAVVIGIIVLVFNLGLRNIVSQTCSHGPECSMYDTISLQTYMALAVAGLVLVIGIVLVFVKPEEKVVYRKMKEAEKKLDLSKLDLDKDEKDIVNYIVSENGAVFQRTLMEKFSLGKVKATRILDKLEAKQIIERKRRGMNNIVVLKK